MIKKSEAMRMLMWGIVFSFGVIGLIRGQTSMPESGTLSIWNTFLGGSSIDQGWGVTFDGNGNIYVIGRSDSTWGSPLNPFSGGHDAFVAKLNANGALQWNTFLGGSDAGGVGISVDGSGNIYITGDSFSTWGSPLNPISGDWDAFVAKLNASGALQWNTFLGGSGSDYGQSISVDGSGNIYITGYSNSTWGSPLNPISGDWDAFVAKLNASGALQWNTFLGGSSRDQGLGIAVDGVGNIYVAGGSNHTWGSPLNPFSGVFDAFVAKLNTSGDLQWNTFLGGSNGDLGSGIYVDSSGNVYVTGWSSSTWGSPLNPYGGGDADAFVAKLNANGALQWSTFLGGSGVDLGNAIAIDGVRNIYVAGESDRTWGSPLNPYGGGTKDAFVARIEAYPLLRIVSPNGGETWPLGSKRKVTWDSNGITSATKLVLFRNGVKLGNIATNLASAVKSYAWTVGSFIGGTAEGSGQFKVRGITMDGLYKDDSDASFAIPPLNLVSPNGYENWKQGSSHWITWTAGGYSGNVKLVLFQNGVKLGNIALNIPASDGSYHWKAGDYIGGTAPVGGGYGVRVITMDGVFRDDSEALFAITAPSIFDVTSPNGGESWPLGGTRGITWTTGGITGNVKLVLFQNGVKVGNIVVDIPSGASPYSWTVGSYIGGTAARGDGYSMRVISMDGVHRDDSNGPFVIE